jgi:hypothetical protein
MFSAAAYRTSLGGVPTTSDTEALADRVFRQVFRRDFDEPGFALVSLGPAVGSRELRRFMVALQDELDERYRRARGRHLVYLSTGRFDQQVSTKFHLDGAPDESYLMLGYEPSEVASELAMADYTRAAAERGASPRRFLDEHNPMFARGEAILAPYVTPLAGFDPASAHVLLVNNGALLGSDGSAYALGVLHRATIPSPDPSRRRVVNSTMLGVADAPDAGPLGPDARRAFLDAEDVAGASYR